jgi:hypothetical protein
VTLLLVLVGVAVLVAAALATVGLRNSRRTQRACDADWTDGVGSEFSGLSEPARCDLVFALGALYGRRSQDLLERALDDPSEPVALAAAHALMRRGSLARVEAHLAARPGERANRLASTLALLTPQS